MADSIARRRFLKLAAMAAAAGLATACSSPPPVAPTSAPAPAPTSAPAAPPTPAPPAPTTAPAAPTATTAPVTVSQAQPTLAPTVAASKFKEAPVLADLVKQGKLPPVDQRLPANPRVVKPLESVGQYGGTWHRAYRGLSDRWGPTKLMEDFVLKWNAADPNTLALVPDIVEKWEQNENATEFTFHLRPGIKWSDGTAVTTDDVKFWHDDIQLNKDLVGTPSRLLLQQVGGDAKIADLTIVDQSNFRVKYAAPYPLLPLLGLATSGGVGCMGSGPPFLAPSKYLKQFHPNYGDKAAIDKLVADKKLSSWTDLWGKAGDMQGPIAFWMLNPDLPVINPWKIQAPPPADPMVMVRNPYYWQVDSEGNQLPYIDQINHSFFDNPEVLKLWVASGKIDCQLRHMDPGSYTFYKENEKKGDYRTLTWRAANTDAYFPNINCPDKVLAKLFDTADFRQALNLAVNRKEINDVVWNGLGTPRQASPVKGSPEYDAELEQVWTAYDPKKANDLLDKLGLTKGSDGVRKRPDGKPLEVIILHFAPQGSGTADANGLVKKYWDAIGVKTTLKYVERSLLEESDHNADVEIGAGFAWDSLSVNKANPDIWLGTLDDNPWAPAYGHWYTQSSYKKEEPPQDHPIRKIWAFWEKTQAEPDEAKRNAYFQQLLGIHKQAPVAVGTVGEKPVPMIVRNNFHNVAGGFIQDDPLRDYGLVSPQQFFIKT